MLEDLKQARLNSGYSKKEVSTMIKISERSLSKYESVPGKTPADVFIKLLAVYKKL